MGRFIIAGSLAYDRIMDFPGIFSDHIVPEKMHALSVSFFVPELRESFGGCAGNIAYTLSLFGHTPTVLGTVGNDFASYEAWLEEHGIDLSLVRKMPDLRTAFASIITDRKNNQIAAFYPGAMKTAYPVSDLRFTKDDFVLISPESPDLMRALPQLARETHGFMYDPGQQTPLLSKEDLEDGMRAAKALIVNDYELSLILEKTGWKELEILDHAETLIVTLGEAGSRIRTRDMEFNIPPAKPARVVDPTGAGDAYRAGFSAGMIRGSSLETAGKMGSLAACYTVETAGTQTHSFTQEEFAKRYEENFNEPLSV
ncbi:MAG: carbohydrate kinase family protein [Patescibacteria group bacterium]|nr:carbohydrate kinase family protein [Patescibacteria group bacterium]